MDAHVRIAQRMGSLLRCNQRDGAFLSDGREGRTEQAHFADARLLQQQFDHSTDGPACAGQRRRQCWRTVVDRAPVGAGELGRTP